MIGRDFMDRCFSTGILVTALLIATSPRHFAEAEAAAATAKGNWEAIVQAGKREGQVTLYASGVYGEIFQEFQKKYPEIKVLHVSGRGADIAQRVMSERRAGKYLADVYILGAGTGHYLYKAKVLDPIGPALLLPEVIDESKWWMGKHKYMDDEGKYVLAFNEGVLPFIGYNKKQVNSAEFRSYWDLLQPKWKGRMVAMDPTVRAAGDHLAFILATPELGLNFIKKLFGEMDLTASADSRQIVDWLAVGRYSISLFTSPSRASLNLAQEQGLPVDWLVDLKEGAGTSTSNGDVALFNRAPHPNAAVVAINWLLSREGQIAYQKYQYGSNSLRTDVPKDNVVPYTQRKAGFRYVGIDSPEWRGVTEQIPKIVSEMWKKR
jgi:ABC-type Fe3+ transport system substrate-binding protein